MFPIYIVFSPVGWHAGVSSLEAKYHILDTEMKELSRSIQINTHNTRLFLCTPHLCLSHLASRKSIYGERVYIHTQSSFILLDRTDLVAVRGLIHQEVPTSASTSGARRSNATTSDKGKQICLSTLPRTGFDAEVCSYLAFHS